MGLCIERFRLLDCVGKSYVFFPMFLKQFCNASHSSAHSCFRSFPSLRAPKQGWWLVLQSSVSLVCLNNFHIRMA